MFSETVFSLEPLGFKTDHIKLSVSVSVIVFETNCITLNRTDSHSFEFREGGSTAAQSIISSFMCVCVCARACLCVFTYLSLYMGGREKGD